MVLTDGKEYKAEDSCLLYRSSEYVALFKSRDKPGKVNRNWEGLHTVDDKEVRCCVGDKLMCNAGGIETWFREEVRLV
jgi:hypothetical protein